MKYIRHDLFGFVIFPSLLKHSDVANNLGWRDEEILSAGFAMSDGYGNLVCRGKSISLGIGSIPDDTSAINKQMGDTRYDL